MTTTQQEAAKTPFEAGIELYNIPKPEGDPDLVKEVRDLLIKSGVSEEAVAEAYDGNRHIKAAQGRASIVQRTQINRFVTLALTSSTENTTDMRCKLLPNGAISAWKEQMESTICPFIAQKNLLG